MRTWISEQNICTLKDINGNLREILETLLFYQNQKCDPSDKCGADAAALYRELQQTVFEPMFPIICEYDIPGMTRIGLGQIYIDTTAWNNQDIL